MVGLMSGPDILFEDGKPPLEEQPKRSKKSAPNVGAPAQAKTEERRAEDPPTSEPVRAEPDPEVKERADRIARNDRGRTRDLACEAWINRGGKPAVLIDEAIAMITTLRKRGMLED